MVPMSTQLLSEIETFLAETGMNAQKFGWEAKHNRRLVERLRAGRDVNTKTAERVRAFMAEQREQTKFQEATK